MASVVHRTTKEFRPSVNTPDFPVGTWVINPDLTAVTGFASKYWIITGDVITLMDQAARDTVDAAEVSARRDQTADQLDVVEGVLRAFALVVLDEINVLRGIESLPDRTIAQLKTAVRGKLGS